MRKIWPFSLSFVFFAGIAFSMPFMVLYYQSLGFSGTQIGILVGITPLVTLFSSPLWTGVADTTHHHRLFMSLVLLAGAATIAVLPFFSAYLLVMLVVVLYYIFFAPVTAFADSATMYMLAGQKEMYGRIRVGGTIGFGIAATVAGFLVQNYGLKITFWGSGLMLFLAFLVSQKLVYNPAASASAQKIAALTLLKDRRWQFFLSLALAAGLASAVTNSYLFPFMKDLGAGEGMMGLALTVGTLSEIPTFIFGSWLLKRFKPYPLFIMALVLTGLRLLVMSFSTTPVLVLGAQLLTGVGFSAMWMAGVSYADENAPLGMSASAQGLFGASVYGFGAAIGGFAGGLLLENLGGRGMYLVSGLVVLATTLLVFVLESRKPVEQGAVT
jgi:PPP family 3-phenylpropionic acid transporter